MHNGPWVVLDTHISHFWLQLIINLEIMHKNTNFGLPPLIGQRDRLTWRKRDNVTPKFQQSIIMVIRDTTERLSI